MAVMDVMERAERYLRNVPASVSGAGGHTQALLAARSLVRGFLLSEGDALRVLCGGWNARCEPPWSESELVHKIRSAMKGPAPKEGDGYLLKSRDREDAGRAQSAASSAGGASAPAWVDAPKTVFDPEALVKFAGDFVGRADLFFTAERSVLDPATVTAEGFLSALYDAAAGERVLVFSTVNRRGQPWTQGEAMWPVDTVPTAGPCGVWYLCQPVDGQYRPINPMERGNSQAKMSRRSGDSLTAWRYMVIESDEAPAREWLAALVQMPLRIAAIYTSGSRSLHALVQVDARSKHEWDKIKGELRDALVLMGADPGAMSGVRLTRLPGALRMGSYAAVKDEEGNALKDQHGNDRTEYVAWSQPGEQKLLYICPSPAAVAICDLPRRRDLVRHWTDAAMAAFTARDVEGLRAVAAVGRYYRRQCPALAKLGEDADRTAEKILTLRVVSE